MLWQSSLLIGVIFTFDLLFARRVRASVRCALWMVVLVKLVLPPSLALPTGATWWLWRPHPVVEAPVIQNYTVSFGNTASDVVTRPTAPVVRPPPKLSGEAWMLFGAAAMGAGLLLWLAFRWLRVAGKVRRAAVAPFGLDGILEEARQLAGLRRCPRLKLIDEAQSPAVYGLFQPVILLPQRLANQFSARQLRAVLLHEAVHLRRGDVWVNFAQTLLQVTYWWHPLLWIANARIRRLREEAVDDAVMLALRDGADAYAPTLLEVAKFAFRRPLASLGLVGILESRSALRQRVERLMDFRPPRRAGVTVLSICGIFGFCAVALPMGQGPADGDISTPPVAENPTDAPNQNMLMQAIQMHRKALIERLNSIHLDVSYGNQPLSRVLADLHKRSVELDPDKKGIHFLFNPNFESSLSSGPHIDPNTGLPLKRNAARKMADATKIKVNLVLNDATLQDVLNGICLVSDHPIQYSLRDYGVVFSAKDPNSPPYEMRTFKTGTNIFLANLRKITGSQNSETNVSATLAELFEKAGLDLSPPKAIYFNHRGILFVYATPGDVDVIERIVSTLHDPHGGEDRWLKSVNRRTVADFGKFLDDPIMDGKTFFHRASNSVSATLLETRTFSVNSRVLFANLDKRIRSLYPIDAPTSVTNVIPRLREFLLSEGVDLDPPKELFYDDLRGVVFSLWRGKQGREHI